MVRQTAMSGKYQGSSTYIMSYRPWRIIWLTTLLTVSTGILKPIPADAPEGLYIDMLQSINRSAGGYICSEREYLRAIKTEAHLLTLHQSIYHESQARDHQSSEQWK